MHETPTIVIGVHDVCLSRGSINLARLCGGHSMQPLPNYFGLFLSQHVAKIGPTLIFWPDVVKACVFILCACI